MITPFSHQIAGAAFLADRQHALLADEPRVGKTGAALMATDLTLAESVLIVTTASGRSVWERAIKQWCAIPREVSVARHARDALAPVTIAGWPVLSYEPSVSMLLKRRWDRLILDESHYAKAVEARRTFHAYARLKPICGGVWCLSGTPMPNAPNDIYPMLRALAPDRLEGVERYEDFLARYCIVRKKKITPYRSIEVVVGGKNEAELHQRLDGFMLRRTQQDIGIVEPIYDTLPFSVTKRQIEQSDGDADRARVLEAAKAGDTRELDMHMGLLRRHTGALKAELLAEFVREELECGLDKLVIMFWHKATAACLERHLRKVLTAGSLGDYAVRLDGSTTPKDRDDAVTRFREDRHCRVFLGQIQAAGEAIDLSASAELIFAEASFTPKDMKQAALRITNVTQKRRPRVRVATLAGSIDEALQEILLRKWTTIREVIR